MVSERHGGAQVSAVNSQGHWRIFKNFRANSDTQPLLDTMQTTIAGWQFPHRIMLHYFHWRYYLGRAGCSVVALIKSKVVSIMIPRFEKLYHAHYYLISKQLGLFKDEIQTLPFSFQCICITFFKQQRMLSRHKMVIQSLALNYLINLNVRFFFWSRGSRKNNYWDAKCSVNWESLGIFEVEHSRQQK